MKLVFDARSASEKFISGSIWFDDFQITREETAEGEARAAPPRAAQQTGAEQTNQRVAAQPLMTLRLLQ